MEVLPGLPKVVHLTPAAPGAGVEALPGPAARWLKLVLAGCFLWARSGYVPDFATIVGLPTCSKMHCTENNLPKAFVSTQMRTTYLVAILS